MGYKDGVGTCKGSWGREVGVMLPPNWAETSAEDGGLWMSVSLWESLGSFIQSINIKISK